LTFLQNCKKLVFKIHTTPFNPHAGAVQLKISKLDDPFSSYTFFTVFFDIPKKHHRQVVLNFLPTGGISAALGETLGARVGFPLRSAKH